ncbi:MAG TPA: Do family serine endopeptidase [Caulobacteraceae bacterium]|nr:Do family serine endopeptidase [Caulobacteraceae bacterium]
MSNLKIKSLSTAAVGAGALLLAGAGGWLAHAQSPDGAVNAPGRFTAQASPGSFADIVAKVAPAVVSINVVQRASISPAAQMGQGPGSDGDDEGGGQGGPGGAIPFPFFRFMIPQGQGQQPSAPIHASGSGFFISADGYVVTNNHVIHNADKITVVTNNNQELTAHVVGADPATDLAVLKVDGGPFQYVSFEDTARPRVGDWVVAVGNPFGLGGTATAGIVSALGRQNVSGSSYVDYMQIDAPINRGNSGGPTFDVAGRVVGVNSAIYTPSGGSVGIGFDIPADVAAQVTRQLISHGAVTRGYIGATVQNLSPDLASSLGLASVKGAIIDQLTPGGPAERAGLRMGDVVTSVNGQKVTSSAELTRQVGLAKPGDDIQLGVLRDGQTRQVAIRSGTRPSEAQIAAGARGDQGGEEQGPSAGHAMLGMQLSPDPHGGLVVQGLSPNTDAAQKGMQAGDVILRAGAEAVASPADLARAVSAARAAGRKSVPLLVARGAQRFYVPVGVNGDTAG